MSKLLISACLLGQKVRYDGADQFQDHPRLHALKSAGRIVTICPEVAGGLAVPRPPAEIQQAKTGQDVLNGDACILTNTGQDVTAEFIRGAEKTLALAQANQVRVAILKARSPSCGSGVIYDGTFSSKKIPGMGTTAALLAQHGIQVFDEDQIDLAIDALELLK